MNQKQEFLKKVRYLLFAIFLCAPLTAMAQGDIAINEENFPDENFRAYLQQYYGQDGVITEEKIKGTTWLNVFSKNIRSLKGIEHFTALEILWCYDNQLTELDLSWCTTLTQLWCSYNLLTSLDVSTCTKLTSLSCHTNTQLTTLNISGCKALTHLNCYNTQLTTLDVSGYTELTELQCWNSSLTYLDVSGCTELTELNCYNNQLTTLDVLGCTKLTRLQCHNNQLTQLDVSKCVYLNCENNQLVSLDVSSCTELTYLDCGYNQLTNLNVLGCAALEWFVCINNQLTSLNVSNCSALTYLFCPTNCLEILDISGCIALTELNCDDNPLVSLNASGCSALPRLHCSGNKSQLSFLDISGCISLTELECGNNQLTALDISESPALTKLTCSRNQLTALDVSKHSALTELDCSNNQLTALDVSKSPALTKLICSSNLLTALDVSKHSALTELDCSNNQLTTLNVSKNPALTNLNCSNNQLTTLDISKNTVLATLNCDNNQLMVLDISKNTVLNDLSCNNNQLTSLDVSNYITLTRLWCQNNLLTSLNASGCIALKDLVLHSNKQLSTLDVSGCVALTELSFYGNQLSTLNVLGCKALNKLQCNDNQLTSLDVTDCISLTSIYCYGNLIRKEAMGAFINTLPQNTTGENNSLYIVGKYNDDNVYSIEQVAAAKAKGWIPYYSDGTEYKGFEIPEDVTIDETNFPDENFRNWLLGQDYGKDGMLTGEEILKITRIDVSKQDISTLKGIEYFTELTSLSCGSNQLTSLDVSKNAALTSLNCGSNQLTSLDVSKNAALTSLSCSVNQLTSLDVSQNTALISLSCDDNQFTSLDVSQNMALTSLNCSNTPLTSLDVSKNTALAYLNCTHNQFTSLDVSQNMALTSLNCFNTPLTSLDVSKNTALTYLNCSTNQLTSLDISKNTALTQLYCYTNQLTSLDVSQNTALTELRCYSNQIKGEAMETLISSLPNNVTNESYKFYVISNSSVLSEGNVCTKDQVEVAKAKGWICYYSNGAEYSGELPEDVTIDETNFPDENFRNWLLKQNYGKDGVLTGDEIIKITSINVSGQNISTLKGIEHFFALTSLYCNNNQLTSLDVSKNITLGSLYCNNNQLTSLDVSENTRLVSLECYSNQIKGAAMDSFISSLPQNPTPQKTYTLRLYYPGNDGNICTKEQVAAAKAKGWASYYTEDDGKSWVEYEGSDGEPEVDQPEGIAIDETTFPDEAFRNWLLTQECGKDSLLTDEEIKGITSIDVSGQGISSLKGIELFTELTTLDCSMNQLTEDAVTELLGSLPKAENGTLRLYDDANESENNVKVLTDAQVALAQENGWALYYYDGTEWVEYGANSDDDDDNTGDGDDDDDNGDDDDNTDGDDNNDDDNTGGDGNDDDDNTGDDNNDDDNPGDDGNDDDDDNATPETPGEDDVVMNEETFPDEGFRDILAELVGAKDGDVLTEEDIKEITSLDISEAGISDLTGIEYLTALTELVCEGNKLESLDVSKNTALTMIDCSRNQISGEAMDAFISSLPEKTAAARATTNDAAEVYVLRVYDSTAADEGNVCTKAQVEAIKAKGWTPYYYNGSEWLEYTGYDDETTGIGWLGTGAGSVSVYNMAGQKVNLPANAKKGVYIVNGKKVVVK